MSLVMEMTLTTPLRYSERLQAGKLYLMRCTLSIMNENPSSHGVQIAFGNLKEDECS